MNTMTKPLEGLLKHAKTGIQKKLTASEKKREKCVALRQCRDAVNKQFSKTAPTTVLAEDESLSSYQRKGLNHLRNHLREKRQNPIPLTLTR